MGSGGVEISWEENLEREQHSMAYFSTASKNEKSGPILACYSKTLIMGDVCRESECFQGLFHA